MAAILAFSHENIGVGPGVVGVTTNIGARRFFIAGVNDDPASVSMRLSMRISKF